MEGLALALLIKPLIAIVCLSLPVLIAYAIWRLMPDSKIKRILFRHYGEPDNMPWSRGQGRGVQPRDGREVRPDLLPRQSQEDD